MIKAEIQPEHEWLAQLVGDWRVSAPMCGPDGGDESTMEWSESVRSLNGLWVVGEGSGAMPDGTPVKTLLTLGYDPARKAYVGTWVGSMMTHMWVYEGQLDGERRVLTLDCQGPDFEGQGGLTRFQDIITLEDDDNRVLSSRMMTADGTWKPVMTAHYRRAG